MAAQAPGDHLDHRGQVAPALVLAVPIQVDIAIARRRYEVRRTLARRGGPLEGLVDPAGHLLRPVDDRSFDDAILEIWRRWQVGEWVGELSSTIFPVTLPAAILGRSEAAGRQALARLEAAGRAGASGITLVEWLPPLDDDRPSDVVDRFEVPGRVVEVRLPAGRRERRTWRVTISDPVGGSLHEEHIVLRHEPAFGPDVTDVWALEERLAALLGGDYPSDRNGRPPA